MEHLIEFVFVSMANLTLARRDSYLSHVKSGNKPDTLAALRTAPLQLATLFPEEDIVNFERKRTQLVTKAGSFPPLLTLGEAYRQ